MTWLKVGLAVSMFILIGCPKAVPPSPLTASFSDEVHSAIVRPLKYRVGDSDMVIEVPAGFVTDYASIPRAFWQILPVHGRYGRAAIVHDYLYWTQRCTREQADNLLLIAMIESGVDAKARLAIYKGVRIGGARAWEGNARERREGRPRVIPKKFLMADDFLQLAGEETWPEYQNRLIRAGVHDNLGVEEGGGAGYCKFGNARVPPVLPHPAAPADQKSPLPGR